MMAKLTMDQMYLMGEGTTTVRQSLLERLMKFVKSCDRCGKKFKPNDNRKYEHDGTEVLCFGCWY